MATDDSSPGKDEGINAFMALGLAAIRAQFRGKRLRRKVKEDRAQLVEDYSGGSLVSQCSQALSLYYDYTFRLEEKTFRAIAGGGISLPSEEVREVFGRWSIELANDELYLLLKRNDGEVIRWTIEERERTFFTSMDSDGTLRRCPPD